MISVLIPSIKKEADLSLQLTDIRESLSEYVEGHDYEIVTNCCQQSSSLNRNACLEKSKGEHVIFVDDDIAGYFRGWAHEMIAPLQADDNIKVVSARLMTPNGTPGTMISYRSYINECREQLWINPHILLPSACIAFTRNTWLTVKTNPDLPANKPFDENYIRACAEDSDFVMAIWKTFPNCKTAVNKKVPIVHASEEKWRTNNPEHWKVNHRLFEKKWGRPCH